MRKLRKIFLMIVVSAVAFITGPILPLHAASDNGAQFTLKPVYPENQSDKTLGYFSLDTKPGQKGKVTVEVANMDPKTTRTFSVKPVDATTNDSAQINYTPSQRKMDKSAKYSLTQLISTGVTIKLPPHSMKPITFNYTIPKDGFEGTILGSIYVIDETPTKASNDKFALNNRFAMALGLSMTNNPKQITMPDLKLSDVQLTTLPGNVPGISARVRNVEPTFFRRMTIDAKVTPKNSQKELYTSTIKNGSMAPNSFFDYKIATDKRALPAGEYTLRMRVKAVNKTWNFEKNFTVTAEASTKLAKKTGQKTQIPWWVWLIGGLFILLLVIIGYLLWKIHRQKRGEDDANSEKVE